MMKYAFAYFNKLGGFFGVPFFVDHKEEFPKALRQSLFAAKKEQLEELSEEEIYYIGSFDNETGIFIPAKDFVTSLSGVVAEVIAKKFGGSENGQA